jgi:AraC-like DNA-binding protein/quercetin dioxygenase-like cupin family protein
MRHETPIPFSSRADTAGPEEIVPVTAPFRPRADRPLRAKQSWISAQGRVQPHHHEWAQLAYSPTGVVRLTMDHGTYLVPPSRALWIPPGVAHAVTVVADTELRTFYLHQPPGRCGPEVTPADELPWRLCRVLDVSELLRALLMQLDVLPDDGLPPSAEVLARERLLSALVLDELRRARPVPLGVALPQDKRLRSLCLAVLADPGRHASLAEWAARANVGASARTLARLFSQELQTSFARWRQQVLLAQAVAWAAEHRPLGQIAGELGYASPSAFSAMVRRALGQTPREVFRRSMHRSAPAGHTA